MCAVVGARQPGESETCPGGQVEFVRMLDGRINHIHLIDSDNSCHKDANGEDETSMHLPFGDGVIEFGPIVAALKSQSLSHDLVDDRPVLLAGGVGRHREVLRFHGLAAIGWELRLGNSPCLDRPSTSG